MRTTKLQYSFLISLLLFLSAACSSNLRSPDQPLRLGYLLNMTHAVPILGLESGRFTNTEGIHFLAGGYLINSLITGNVDLAYIGPGPVINAIGKDIDLLILSGSSTGGNSLVYAPDFDAQSKTKTRLAIPQYGNTQDILARAYFQEKADVDYIPVNPAEVETVFYTKSVDAAFVPEPWGTILESSAQEAHAYQVAKDLKIDQLNDYPSALLVVNRGYYEHNKEKVDQFLLEQKQVLAELMQAKSSGSSSDASGQVITLVKSHLKKITKKDLSEEFLQSSFDKVAYSNSINISLLAKLAWRSKEAKYLRKDIDLAKHILALQKKD